MTASVEPAQAGADQQRGLPVELTINGKTHQLEVEADMPLLWALRDVLSLTGTKYGCAA